jgi:outer membrane biosynthesis protein TonB
MKRNALIACKLVATTACAAFFVVPAAAQSQSKECAKPPKLLSAPKFSEEARQRFGKKKIEATVVFDIGEDGGVLTPKITKAKTKEMAEAVLAAVKNAKYEPRPGCRPLEMEMTFHLQPDDKQ